MAKKLKILVTGASTGIGEATALRLARRGHELVLCARSKHLLEDVARACETRGGKAHVLAADLSEKVAPERVVSEAASLMGGIDVLINNAGRAHGVPVERQDPAKMDQIIDLNIRALFVLTHFAIPHLKKSKRPRIINVASVVGHLPMPGLAVYSASKFAVVGFSEALAAELGPSRIGVSVICPGLVDTPMAENFPGGVRMSPERVAAAIEGAIARPTRHVFVPRMMESASLARRFAPVAVTRGMKVYGRMRRQKAPRA